MNTNLKFDGVSVDLNRTGDNVAGFVTFPKWSNRSPVDIRFRAAYPAKAAASQRSIDGPNSAVRKRAAVTAYRNMIADDPNTTRGEIAKRIAKQFGTSTRSLQRWDRQEAVDGPSGLIHKSTVSRLPLISPNDENLDDAVFTCAWWSHRIANLAPIIDQHVAQALLLRRAYSMSDILATIDCYYGWDCDRERYPFKPFSRWGKHDFEKWLHRARQDAQFKHARAEVRYSLRAVKKSNTAPLAPAPDPITRKRDVAASRRNIALSFHSGETCHEKAGSQGTAASRLHAPSSVAFSPGRTALADVGRGAATARAMGLPDLADHLVTSAVTPEPETIAGALTAMSDGFRVAILSASQGDRKARIEAIATMPIWFEWLPNTVRNNIEFRVRKWQRDHPSAKQRDLFALRFDHLLKAMQQERKSPDTARPLAATTGLARGLLDPQTVADTLPIADTLANTSPAST